MDSSKNQSKYQTAFNEMVLGTLIYSVVISLFADYTNLLIIGTESMVIAVAFTLQVLTFLTLLLKSVVLKTVRKRQFKHQKIIMVAAIWPILFFSKFIFLWVLEVLFGAKLDIGGLVGLVLIIVTMALAQWVINWVYKKLGDI